MDNEVWSKLVNAARDAEIELRKVSFDTMRPPIPVATYNRLVAQAYARIIVLEERLASLEQGKMYNAKLGATELRGAVGGAFKPEPEAKQPSAK